jgi:hypothetical protein
MQGVLQEACQFWKTAQFRHSRLVKVKFTLIDPAPGWDFSPMIGKVVLEVASLGRLA